MREIKFRAYVKDMKKVLPVYSIDFSWLEDEPITIASCGDLNCGMCLDFYKKESVELMQFTGLKDRNGKEIYEGDVMPVNGQNCYIVFCEEYARFCLQMKSGRMFIPSKNSEIIGNIYEHPHLLEALK